MAQPLPPLSHSQRETFEKLRVAAQSAPLTVLFGKNGGGTSTVLAHLHRQLGGRYITTVELMDAMGMLHPHATEEAIRRLLEEALKRDDLILFDDFDLIAPMLMNHEASARPQLFNVVEEVIFDKARYRGKRIVLGQHVAHDIWNRSVDTQAIQVEIPEFTCDDYRDILHNLLGEQQCAQLDIEKLYHFARKLTGYQLQQLVYILQEQGVTMPTLEQCLDVLERFLFVSNVRMQEVEAVSSEQLRGTDELFEQLEKLIILPVQEPELAKQLGLKPKRGVLLHGAPGTGKTSIGRMLAHRMKGKFFMIDGSFISDGVGFFTSVDYIFSQAKANSPSIVFIDDADLIFTAGVHQGFTRYLLTQLDGLETASIGAVCVMMTAMDINDIPAAILRSGRIEVWLETKLPEYETRREILSFYANDLSQIDGDTYRGIDIEALAHHTEGFTPADLRRVIGDGTAFMAYDIRKKRKSQPFGTYLLKSADILRELKNTAARITN